jgi:hypothetical protein
MSDGTTNLIGIPVPSTNPFFLGIVSVHIALGLAAVIAGAVAMLSAKGRGRHANFGTIYFRCLAGSFVTTSALTFVRWSDDYHLFMFGALSFACAYTGRLAIRRRSPRLHLAGMATSYIVMLTAFYVDNGKNLPVWRELPHIAYWIIPAAIGVPIAVYFLIRLPRIHEPEWRP